MRKKKKEKYQLVSLRVAKVPYIYKIINKENIFAEENLKEYRAVPIEYGKEKNMYAFESKNSDFKELGILKKSLVIFDVEERYISNDIVEVIEEKENHTRIGIRRYKRGDNMGKNVKQYENILEKIIIKFGIEVENKENALEVIGCLKEKKISISTINVYPNIVNIKSNKVSNIIDAFIESNLPIEILEKNPSIIEKTTGARVKKIAELLNEKILSKKMLEKFPEIVAVGKNDNILNILKLFQNIKVEKKYFETLGGDILAYGDSAEIKKIIAVLEKYDLLKAVLKKYPKVFYSNNSSVIEDIIALYKNPKEKLRIKYIKKTSRNFSWNN